MRIIAIRYDDYRILKKKPRVSVSVLTSCGL